MMTPGFCLTRLNYRYNQMTSKTPCSNCKCEPSIYDSDYVEIDSSPLATQQKQWLESPSSFFFRECVSNPNSHHCRIN